MQIENLLQKSALFGIGLIVLFTFLLAGCGGGGSGGGTGSVTSTLSFPLQSAEIASIMRGSSTSYTVSGDCNGTASLTSPIPVAASFEAVSGVSVTTTSTISLTNCNPSSTTGTSTDYYDSNYVPLGTVVTGGDYGVFLTPPNIPASVKVGDTGAIGALINYTDNTKSVTDGQDVSSYVVEADTANTAIVNIIIKSYNVGSVLTSTEQDRYRISANGEMTPISSDIQDANGSTTHFVLTAIHDTTPPTVLSTNPTSGSTTVSPGTSISATFSELIDPATITTASFTLMNGTTPVSGTVTYSGVTATFTPTASLISNTSYTVTIATGVKDLAGNSMTSNYSWSFTTTYQTPYPYVDVLHTSLAFDSTRGLLYAFVPSGDANHPNTFAIIDVNQRTVGYSPVIDFVPLNLAVSPDGSYLYVGTATTNEVVRLSLPDFSINMRVSLGTDLSAPACSPLCQPFISGQIAVSPQNPELFAVPLTNNNLAYDCPIGIRIYSNSTVVTQLYNTVNTSIGDIVNFDSTGTQLTTLCSQGYPDIVSRLTFDGSSLAIVDSQHGISGIGNTLGVSNSRILTGSGNVFVMPGFTLLGSLPPLTTISLDGPPLLQGCVFADDTGVIAACLSETFEGYPTPRAFVLYELINANYFSVVPLDLPLSHGTSRIIRTGVGQFAVSVGPSTSNQIFISPTQYLSQNTRIYFLSGINTTYP